MREGRRSSPNLVYHLVTSIRKASPRLQTSVAQLAVDTLLDWQQVASFLLLALVIMPEHVHILGVLTSDLSVSAAMGRWKSYFVRALSESTGWCGKFWQPGFFERRVRWQEDLGDFVRYIERNPIPRGLAARPQDYPFSSANPEVRQRLLGWEWIGANSEAVQVGGAPSHMDLRRWEEALEQE
jgi:REP element-mobilizing transposase RayT